MKVAYITIQFPNIAETFASTDINSLKSMGVDVSIYSMKGRHIDHNKMIKERDLNKLSIHQSNFLEIIIGFWIGIYNVRIFISTVLFIIKCDPFNYKENLKMLLLLPSTFYICSELKKNPPDIVHLFWGHYPSLVIYVLQKMNIRPKTTMFLGAYDLVLDLGVSKYTAQKVDLIFTHSESNINHLIKQGYDRSKIKMIYRGIDLNNSNAKIGIKKIKGRILTAGTLIFEKRFDLVIDLLNEGLNKGFDLTLEICGTGPEKDKLKKQVEDLSLDDRVSFIGHISQNKLFEKMSKAPFFIFLSEKRSERLPNVLKEAMSFGCVCISSNSTGISELISSGNDGFVFTKRNYQNIYKCFELGDVELKHISENARTKIIKLFDVRSSMKRYLNYWNNILK